MIRACPHSDDITAASRPYWDIYRKSPLDRRAQREEKKGGNKISALTGASLCALITKQQMYINPRVVNAG